MQLTSQEGRVFIVTGANTGIGRVTARELARAGAHVILACRSLERSQEALDEINALGGAGQGEFMALDLGDLESVRGFAQAFLARDLPLHGLINNAGLAGQRGSTSQGFELAFGVNHLGHFLLTLLLLDRLKESAPARIVNVASRAHSRSRGLDFEALRQPTKTTTGFPEYQDSKLANVLFTAEMRRRLEGSQVTCVSLHPGVVASDIWRRVPWPLRGLMKLFMVTNEEGAQTTLHCATSPQVAQDPALYYNNSKPHKASRLARDPQLAQELWKRSQEWTGAPAS